MAAEEAGVGDWKLSLSLRGDDLDPKAMSALLGVTPSGTRTRGETRVLSSGKSVVTKIGVWHVDVRAGSPAECVSALATRFGGRLPDLSRLPGVEEAFLDMLVLFERGKNSESDILAEWAPDALRQVAECGLPLQITFGVIDP